MSICRSIDVIVEDVPGHNKLLRSKVSFYQGPEYTVSFPLVVFVLFPLCSLCVETTTLKPRQPDRDEPCKIEEMPAIARALVARLSESIGTRAGPVSVECTKTVGSWTPNFMQPIGPRTIRVLSVPDGLLVNRAPSLLLNALVVAYNGRHPVPTMLYNAMLRANTPCFAYPSSTQNHPTSTATPTFCLGRHAPTWIVTTPWCDYFSSLTPSLHLKALLNITTPFTKGASAPLDPQLASHAGVDRIEFGEWMERMREGRLGLSEMVGGVHPREHDADVWIQVGVSRLYCCHRSAAESPMSFLIHTKGGSAPLDSQLVSHAHVTDLHTLSRILGPRNRIVEGLTEAVRRCVLFPEEAFTLDTAKVPIGRLFPILVMISRTSACPLHLMLSKTVQTISLATYVHYLSPHFLLSGPLAPPSDHPVAPAVETEMVRQGPDEEDGADDEEGAMDEKEGAQGGLIYAAHRGVHLARKESERLVIVDISRAYPTTLGKRIHGVCKHSDADCRMFRDLIQLRIECTKRGQEIHADAAKILANIMTGMINNEWSPYRSRDLYLDMTATVRRCLATAIAEARRFGARVLMAHTDSVFLHLDEQRISAAGLAAHLSQLTGYDWRIQLEAQWALVVNSQCYAAGALGRVDIVRGLPSVCQSFPIHARLLFAEFLQQVARAPEQIDQCVQRAKYSAAQELPLVHPALMVFWQRNKATSSVHPYLFTHPIGELMDSRAKKGRIINMLFEVWKQQPCAFEIVAYEAYMQSKYITTSLSQCGEVVPPL